MIPFWRHIWRGEDGTRYRFRIALYKKDLPDFGGIYVFVRRRFVFFLEPLYVGKAANLQERLVGHEKWGRAFWFYGATERHVITMAQEADRRKAEENLVRGLKPRMNDQMVPRSAKDLPKNADLRKAWFDRNWFRLWLGKRRTKASA
jgi:hypothetical protein